MGKWYGAIGYSDTVETEPGLWEETIVEHNCMGDIIRAKHRYQSAKESTNTDISLSNEISILSDPYISNHISDIRYATHMGTKWQVTNVEVQQPRLILSLGGRYND